MKKIDAIIRTSKFEEVHDALAEIGIPFLTFTEVKGLGLEHQSQTYRGTTYDVGFIPRTKLEIVVNDDQLKGLVDTLLKVANTGEVGDGKIFVFNIDEAYRIRTGEKGEAAL